MFWYVLRFCPSVPSWVSVSESPGLSPLPPNPLLCFTCLHSTYHNLSIFLPPSLRPSLSSFLSYLSPHCRMWMPRITVDARQTLEERTCLMSGSWVSRFSLNLCVSHFLSMQISFAVSVTPFGFCPCLEASKFVCGPWSRGGLLQACGRCVACRRPSRAVPGRSLVQSVPRSGAFPAPTVSSGSV